jgi:hypothetical protein
LINLHQNNGKDYKTTTMAVDSMTFGDFATPGTLVFNSYTDTSIVYEAHSKVKWAATYKGNYIGIAGGFNYSDLDLLFDEANPANIKFDGKVQLSKTNSFEPGREGAGHCLITALGVVANQEADDITYRENVAQPTGFDTIVTAVYSIDDATDWATLVAAPGSVERYGDGYKAMADFTFRGVTTTIPVYFKYIAKRGTAVKWYYCFEGTFQFLAGNTASDPYFCGTNIKSMVTVTLDFQFTDI